MICPQSVASDERAMDYWRMYLDNVAPGHLTPVDGPLLARLCMALALADQANEELVRTGGLMLTDAAGRQTENPCGRALERHTDTARKLAVELAIPPAQRNRLGPVAHTPRGGPAIDAAWEALEE
jgi:phage terminase small subunit